jgi:hypothetical protein
MSNFEFECVYNLAGEMTHDLAPDVCHDPDSDVYVSDGWSVITGKTGQYGYRGAAMHPSETADDATVLEWVRESGGSVFAIVEVRDENWDYPEGDPIGWAIAYR